MTSNAIGSGAVEGVGAAGPFERLVGLARGAGGLLLHPYMAIESVWELAEALAPAAGVPVRVLGPLPDTTRLVNDKARFGQLVERLLGKESLTRTVTSNDPQVVTEALHEFARDCDAVALKRPSCASGLGNRVFAGRSLVCSTLSATPCILCIS